uniref:CCAAT-binding factor domain-containing protein n=1 Tax=Globisporangium ultimum (strain ATCC 200006 / CBS 805.95 / DAOM BR144) TaxID=431595 RepID=K3WE85_GLOUD
MASAAEIKQLEAKIKEDVKQINELPKIVKALKYEDKAVSQAAMLSMRRVLLFFLEKGDLKATTKESGASSGAKKAKAVESGDAITKFRKWLWGVYVSFIKEMLDWLLNKDDSNVQVGALRTLMEFVGREGEMRGNSNAAFGNETFMRVIQQLMAMPKLKGELASVFKGEYIAAYVDVQYYMLKNLTQLLESEFAKDDAEKDENDFSFAANALKLLGMVKIPESEDEITSFLVETKDNAADLPEEDLVSDDSDSDSDDEAEEPAAGSKRKANDAAASKPKKKTKGLCSVKQHQHAFSQAWVAVLRHRLPQDAYKKILVQLPDDIMPHLVNPLLLSDFLTDSYNIGGVTSLLALNSLFILIQDYNFDYPDFYNKLYRLLNDPSLLSAKQRNRFFGLLDLFLSSTHLPAYMIAAFAKRMSRLSLVAEPGAIMFIIPMVYNLILRHKECLQLIHRTGSSTAAEKALKRREAFSSGNAVDAAAKKLSGESTEIALKDGHDPFLSEEQDPIKCNALQSSLWELHTMKQHYNAEVALKANLFEEKLRNQFLDLDDVMDITYKNIFDKQLKRKEKGKVPLAFHPCTSLFTEDDGFAKVFEL